jgi:hypothetical protein
VISNILGVVRCKRRLLAFISKHCCGILGNFSKAVRGKGMSVRSQLKCLRSARTLLIRSVSAASTDGYCGTWPNLSLRLTLNSVHLAFREIARYLPSPILCARRQCTVHGPPAASTVNLLVSVETVSSGPTGTVNKVRHYW